MENLQDKYAPAFTRLRQPDSNARKNPAPAHNGPPASVFQIAVSFALVAGLAQLVVLGFEKFALNGYIHQSPDVLWMAPLSTIVIFLIPAFVLWLGARKWEWFASPPLATLVFALLGFLSVLIMADRIDKLASIVLASGLAAQTARALGAHPARLAKFLRLSVGPITFLTRRKMAQGSAPPARETPVRSEPALSRREFLVSTGGTIGALALGVSGWRSLEEQAALLQLPLNYPEAPNVLLITLDTVRAANLNLYGYSRVTTPHLARFAKSGVLFQRAYGTASWTLPSHGSLFTGHYPHEMVGEWVVPFDSSYPTLAEILRGQGYVTAGFVANTIYCSKESGLGRGFAHFEDYKTSPGQIMQSSSLGFYISDSSRLRQAVGYYELPGRKTGAEVTDDFLRWLASRGARPFFAFLNYWDAHEPYLPPAPFDGQFGRTARNMFAIDRGARMAQLPRQELEAEINAYDSSIAYLDSQLGRLLDELQARGLLENTCVIITSDHGEEFGEHDLFRHGHSLYIASLHVPLLILFPRRVPANLQVSAPVSLRDVPATILDLIGGKTTQVAGHSLARFWDPQYVAPGFGGEVLLAEIGDEVGKPAWFPTSRGRLKSLVADNYQYISNADGQEELYDFENDPLESNDLSSSERGKRLIRDFRGWLENLKA